MRLSVSMASPKVALCISLLKIFLQNIDTFLSDLSSCEWMKKILSASRFSRLRASERRASNSGPPSSNIYSAKKIGGEKTTRRIMRGAEVCVCWERLRFCARREALYWITGRLIMIIRNLMTTIIIITIDAVIHKTTPTGGFSIHDEGIFQSSSHRSFMMVLQGV